MHLSPRIPSCNTHFATLGSSPTHSLIAPVIGLATSSYLYNTLVVRKSAMSKQDEVAV